MKGITHVGVGVTSYVAVCSAMQKPFSSLELAAVIIASLLPDIDHPKSLINKHVLPFKNKNSKTMVYICLGIIVIWFDSIYTNEVGLKILGVTFIAVAMTSHRNGFTHSIVGMIIFAFIGRYIEQKTILENVMQGVIIGYGMHLICDSFTSKGIPIFYPFSKKKKKAVFTYKVGSQLGNSIEFVLVILSVCYIVYALPNIYMR